MKTNEKILNFIYVNRAVYLPLVILIAILSLQFHKDINNMIRRWNNEDLSYGYLVPLVFVYLIYLRRDVFKSFSFSPSYSGIILFCLSGTFYIAGKTGSLETFTYLSIWISIISVFLILFGTHTVKRLAFPFVILGFIIPVPEYLNQMFTFRLKIISSELSATMMRWAGLSVFRDGNVIDLGVTQLQVVDACSGLRYVLPLLLMGFIFAYLFHKSRLERLVVIGMTIPISILANAMRIAVTGYLTLKVSHEVAQGFFHGLSGWMVFMISFILLVLFGRIIRRHDRVREAEKTGSADIDSSTIEDMKGLSRSKLYFLWSACFVCLFFWGCGALLSSPTVKVARKSFENFPDSIGEWRGSKTFLEEDILKSLWADDYVMISFKNEKFPNTLLLLVPYYDYQGPKHTAHAPASCLIGGGYALLSKRVISRDFPPSHEKVKIGQMILEKGDQKILSNYWFQGRGRIIAGEYSNKWYLLWDSITRRRSDGALVRIETTVDKGQAIEDVQNIMDIFTGQLMGVLTEYIPE
ncbi:MAG: VPLPA-CTERM-specific exosortase XrtD [Deltaproteobacteria bacterium]|nr:VPLPA-CTERM-specific exosortase XrtD [Deltaproteobacteria bacterium]